MVQATKSGALLLGLLVMSTFVKAQDNIVLKNGTEIKAKVMEVSPTEIKYRRQDNPDGPVYTTEVGSIFLIQYANGTKDVLNQAPANRPLPDRRAGNRFNGGRMRQNLPANQQPDALERLRYRSGVFNHYFQADPGGRMSNREVQGLMVANPDALYSFERGQSLRRWAWITGGAAVALVGTGAAFALSEGFGHDGFGGRNGHDNDNGQTGPSTQSVKGNDRRDGAVVGYALAGGGVLFGIASVVLNHKATVQFRRATRQYNERPATSLHLTPGYRGTGLGLALQF